MPISLPFRFYGTTLTVAPEDRFNLESLQAYTRFRLPGGTQVVAMTDGLLSIRPVTPSGLPRALVLRPLLPHQLTTGLGGRLSTLQLLGIEQIIYTGLNFDAVARTACYTWNGSRRGSARRIVQRGVRGASHVSEATFLAGQATIRVSRNDFLFRSEPPPNDQAHSFEVALGLTAQTEPYLADVMTFISWWQEFGMLAHGREDPVIPPGLLEQHTPTRLPVIGPRAGDASYKFDSPETLVMLRRPPADATLIPPELVRIGVGYDAQLRLSITPPNPSFRLYGEPRSDRGRRVLEISPDAGNAGQFVFDPLRWERLPTALQRNSFVDLEVRHDPSGSFSGIGIRAFRPPPNPRGRGRIEDHHSEEHRGNDVTGRYEQYDATPPWQAWSMQINAAGTHLEAWVQTRPFRQLHLSGDTTSRTLNPVQFVLTGREVFPSNSAITANLQFIPTSSGFDAALHIGSENINLRRFSTVPRLSDEVLDGLIPYSAEIRDFIRSHELTPLTRGQVASCRNLVDHLIPLVREYFQVGSGEVGSRARQGVIAIQLNNLINEWFSGRLLLQQHVLGRYLLIGLLSRIQLDLPASGEIIVTRTIRANASAWLRVLLDERSGDTMSARNHLGLSATPTTAVFTYRWKFRSIVGPEGSAGWFGLGLRGGLMRVERVEQGEPGRPVEVIWQQDYGVVVGSVSIGRSIGFSVGESDSSWNDLTSYTEWSRTDFVGTFSIVAASVSHDFEGVTPPGAGSAVFISNNRRDVISGGADGSSITYGFQIGAQVQQRFGSILGIGVSSQGPSTTLPRLFLPTTINRTAPQQSSVLDFETGEARINPEGWAFLRSYICLHLNAMRNPATEITIIGRASRLGSDIDNQILSERRAENVRRAIDDILGMAPRARIIDVEALGERSSSGNPNSNEPADRSVSIFVNGIEVLRLD
ncbi:hypothetical protein EXU57_24045 [Segetibacter sp. 3557_3]|uniref:OmpA family protein n=1 Tax=Segetibacter sp. 3557_3 TaxID=2547429 RepID=UPI00105864EE|nr:OmpA family protein [Segetibacter sp. 3557_3]TDH18253.1 hypothetical protein EXU57_24045 [Segetibacter sp. 3557_3]